MYDERYCPDLSVLERFLLGHVIGATADLLERHLADCPRCAQRIGVLQAEDELVVSLRRRSRVLVGYEAAEADRLIPRMRELRDTHSLKNFTTLSKLDETGDA